MGPFSIYEQPKYKPNLTLILIQIQTLILTQILTLKPTWVDATIRSHFGCSYIEKEPVKAMPPNTDFARLGLGPVTPLVLTKYYIIIITNTKPGPESFPAMINLPRYSWAPAVSL